MEIPLHYKVLGEMAELSGFIIPLFSTILIFTAVGVIPFLFFKRTRQWKTPIYILLIISGWQYGGILAGNFYLNFLEMKIPNSRIFAFGILFLYLTVFVSVPIIVLQWMKNNKWKHLFWLLPLVFLYIGLKTNAQMHPISAFNSTLKPYYGYNSGMPQEYGVWVNMLALAALYTWGIGLTPPLLIRFLFVRRPMGKWWAIGTAAMFFFINIILFTILDKALSEAFEDLNIYRSKSHVALILVAAVSYFILRKKLKYKPQSEKKPNEKGGKHGWLWILFGLLCIYLIGMLVVLKDIISLDGIYSFLEWQKVEGIVGLMVILGIVSGFIFWVRFLFSKYIFIDNKEESVKSKLETKVSRCPNCTQLNTTNRTICKNCGAVLQEGNCPVCKKPIKPGTFYCSHCCYHENRGLGDVISDIQDKTLGFWDKIKNRNKSITMERKWAALAKGDTQAKVASIVGKPESVENEGEDSTQEKWIFECGSGGKRSITFKDGFMVKIEVKYQ